MGVRPILGRTFAESEGVQGNEHVVILGFGLWQRRFSGDRNIVGETVTIDLEPYTVVGVMPRGFAFPDTARRGSRLFRNGTSCMGTAATRVPLADSSRRHLRSWRSATSM